jgi:hypothetical protein
MRVAMHAIHEKMTGQRGGDRTPKNASDSPQTITKNEVMAANSGNPRTFRL